MSSTQMHNTTAMDPQAPAMAMKLEVIVIPVSNVDRAKGFYGALGWRLDADLTNGDGFRVIQFTPPGSPSSIIFGSGVTSAIPGSVQGLHVIVSDIGVVRAELLRRGIDVSEPFHDIGGIFHHAGHEGRLPGPDPARRSYGSFASFSDPDGNGWLLQEVTERLPGRVDADPTKFASVRPLGRAPARCRRARRAREADRPVRRGLAGLVRRLHRPRAGRQRAAIMSTHYGLFGAWSGFAQTRIATRDLGE